MGVESLRKVENSSIKQHEHFRTEKDDKKLSRLLQTQRFAACPSGWVLRMLSVLEAWQNMRLCWALMRHRVHILAQVSGIGT